MMATVQQRLNRLVPTGRVARGIITLVSGTAAAQLIAICAMPIITRLYSPAEVGLLSLFMAFIGFWAGTLSLRYEYALLIATDDTQSHIVHRLAMLLVVMMSVLGLPILWGLHYADVLGFGLLPAWAPLVVVPALLGSGMFMVYRSWALRAGMVKSISKATILRASADSGAQVVLGFLVLGVPGLFAAKVAGSWAAMLKLVGDVGKHFAPSRPARISRADLIQVARTFIKFPLLEAPSTWVNQLALTLPLPMIATLHGATAAGWFGLARMMVGIPNSQIGSAVADVFQMELAGAVIAGDKTRARRLFYKLMRRLALIGLAPMLAVMAIGPWIVPFVFGENWREAGIAAVGIAPWMYAALIVSPLSRTLSVLQAQEFKLGYDISAISLLTAAYLVSKVQQYSFIETIVAISGAGIISYAVYAVLLVMIIERRLKRN